MNSFLCQARHIGSTEVHPACFATYSLKRSRFQPFRVTIQNLFPRSHSGLFRLRQWPNLFLPRQPKKRLFITVSFSPDVHPIQSTMADSINQQKGRSSFALDVRHTFFYAWEWRVLPFANRATTPKGNQAVGQFDPTN